MLKIFMVKVILHMLNFWGVENSFSYVTKLNKINTVKSQKFFQLSILPHYVQQFLVTS